MLKPDGVLETLTGRGLVSAEGCETVRVRYRVLIAHRQGRIIAHGHLHGSHAGLRPFWLESDAQLHLKNGRRLDVALTDLIGDAAEFESTGPIGLV